MEIKQIMPMPTGCTVMVWVTSPCGVAIMKNSTSAYCLALVKHTDGSEAVVPYNLGTGIDETAEVVLSRLCPQCGAEMVPYRIDGDPVQRYHCSCGTWLTYKYWEECPLCRDCKRESRTWDDD